MNRKIRTLVFILLALGFSLNAKENNTQKYELQKITTSSVNGTLTGKNYTIETGKKYLWQTKEVFNAQLAATDNLLPIDFGLEQNYPNPFNPVTTIKFSLPLEQDVKITVFNIKGESVAKVVSGNYKSGVHSVKFNASNLASGQYFYRMETKGFNKIKKMLLVK